MKCVMRTFSGRDINPLDIQPEDININDIAHALALCNRFAGHTAFPISVAQHSWYVSMLCNGTGSELQGLLHDASESILGDMTKWLKQTEVMSGYRTVEGYTQKAIYDKYKVYSIMTPEVEKADRLMVRFEGLMGFGDDFKIDHPRYPPLMPEEINMVNNCLFWTPWDWKVAEFKFIERFNELTAGKR